eukprot:10655375-Lingulodinium_polyedra.AAC.1
MRRRARALADALGIAVPATAAADGVWLFADPGRENFDSEVPLEIVGPQDRFVERGAAGLAQ